MAKKSDVRYIRYYTVGSAARELSPPAPQQPKPAVRPRKAKKIVLYIDPVAILGMVTAVVLMICMLSGLARLNDLRIRHNVVQGQIQRLVEENRTLEATYAASYTLDDIEKTALALGMVPAEQVAHIQLGN